MVVAGTGGLVSAVVVPIGAVVVWPGGGGGVVGIGEGSCVK